MWAKLDDHVADHPKIMAVGNDGLAAFVRALVYSAKHLTDGFIPEYALPVVMVGCNGNLLSKMLEVGLWEQAEGGIRIHDYHDHNLPADVVRERREKIKQIRSEAGKRGAEVRWHSKHSKTIATVAINSTSQTPWQNDGPVPVPVPKEEREGVRKRTTRAPFRPPTLEEVEAYKAEINGVASPQAFLNHWEALGWVKKSGPVVSWKACYRTWETNEARFASERGLFPAKSTRPADTNLKPMRRSEDAE